MQPSDLLRIRPPHQIFVLSALLLTGLSTVATAAKPKKSFSGTATTTVVEVPVEVTLDGEPLRGLTAEDFEVLDRGKEQAIIGIDVVDLKAIEGPAETAVTEVPIAARRHFMLLFDLTFAAPSAIERARLSALQLVEEDLHTADLVAVATYSRVRGAQMVLGFTSDRRQVEVALETLGLPQLLQQANDPLRLVLGVSGADSLRQGLDNGGGGGGDVDKGVPNFDSEFQDQLRQASNQVNRNDAAQQRGEVTSLARSLRDLAAVMRPIEGRKHVVYFSEGFDSQLMVGTTSQDRRSELAEQAARGEYSQVDSDEYFGSGATANVLDGMVTAFRQADCMVHSIDVGGLRADGDFARNARGKDGLVMMASGTGGQFYENFNRLGEAMGKLLERTSVTYVLAFQPTKLRPDGKYHKLKVRLKDGPRGAKIAHRPGYFAPDPDAPKTAVELQLETAQQLLDGREGGTIDTAVMAVPLRAPAATDESFVRVLVEVDGKTLLTEHPGDRVQTEIYVYAMDLQGGIADFTTQSLTLDLKRTGERLIDGGFKLSAPLALGAGDYSIRVLVRNAMTGATGLRIASVRVDGYTEPALLPPMFPEPLDRWLLVRAAREELASLQPPDPFFFDTHRFVPAAKAGVLSRGPVPVFVMGYGLQGMEPEIYAEVFDAAGNPVPEASLGTGPRVAGHDGIERFLTVLNLPEMAQGAYRLNVTMQDPVSGWQRSTSLPFEVVPENEVTRLLAFNMDTLPQDQLRGQPPPVDDGPNLKLAERYRSVLGRMGEIPRSMLLDELAALEVEAIGGQPERRLARLARSELKVAEDLAAQDVEALVPLMMLHHDACLAHKRERQTHLGLHAMQMVMDIAALYAKQGSTVGSKIQAARALVSLGGHLQQAGQKASLTLFEKALEYDPKNEAALLGLAAYAEKHHSGSYDNTVGFLERLVHHHPESREGRLRLAINLLRLGREKDGLKELQLLLKQPEPDWVYELAAQEMARYHAEHGALEPAINVLKTASKELPYAQKLHIQLAYLLDRNRRTYEAAQLLERVSSELVTGQRGARERYNQWPIQALAIDRKELQDGADSRQPILAYVAQSLH